MDTIWFGGDLALVPCVGRWALMGRAECRQRLAQTDLIRGRQASSDGHGRAHGRRQPAQGDRVDDRREVECRPRARTARIDDDGGDRPVQYCGGEGRWPPQLERRCENV